MPTNTLNSPPSSTSAGSTTVVPIFTDGDRNNCLFHSILTTLLYYARQGNTEQKQYACKILLGEKLGIFVGNDAALLDRPENITKEIFLKKAQKFRMRISRFEEEVRDLFRKENDTKDIRETPYSEELATAIIIAIVDGFGDAESGKPSNESFMTLERKVKELEKKAIDSASTPEAIKIKLTNDVRDWLKKEDGLQCLFAYIAEKISVGEEVLCILRKVILQAVPVRIMKDWKKEGTESSIDALDESAKAPFEIILRHSENHWEAVLPKAGIEQLKSSSIFQREGNKEFIIDATSKVKIVDANPTVKSQKIGATTKWNQEQIENYCKTNSCTFTPATTENAAHILKFPFGGDAAGTDSKEISIKFAGDCASFPPNANKAELEACVRVVLDMLQQASKSGDKLKISLEGTANSPEMKDFIKKNYKDIEILENQGRQEKERSGSDSTFFSTLERGTGAEGTPTPTTSPQSQPTPTLGN